jgi:hypothetical protein
MSTENKEDGAFGKLVGELEQLRKSTEGSGDAAIAAAAAAGSDEGDGDADNKGGASDGDADNKDEKGEEGMEKSLTLFDKDGKEVEAVDGTAMVKALQTELSDIKTARAQENDHLGKALTSVHDMLKSQAELIKAQGSTIASLNEQMSKLAGSGRGQRSATVIPVAGEMAKGGEAQLTDGELMAKCDSLISSGKISGTEVSMAETYINRGLPIPAHIRARLSA